MSAGVLVVCETNPPGPWLSFRPRRVPAAISVSIDTAGAGNDGGSPTFSLLKGKL